MSSSLLKEPPHAVCIPYPSQGHVTPMMQLAKLLHSRGFYITFVNTEFNHGRFLRSQGPNALKGLPDFRFEAIPDGLPPSDRDATQDVPALCDSVRKNCLEPLLKLLAKLNSSSDSPRVSCIVSDGVMSFAIKAGEILGIPEVQFWTTSACAFMGYLQFRELIKRGLTPLKDETYLTNGYTDTVLDWVRGMPNIKLKDLPSFAITLTTDSGNRIMFDFMGEEAQNCLNSKAIIFNTFDDLEQEVLDAIASTFPSIYTLGPLSILLNSSDDQVVNNSLPSSLWKEDLECLKWLENREPRSVIYVNFGSVTVISEQDLREFAWGLANSNHPFLWIIRDDIIMGESAILSREFIEETKDRGIISRWCPQEQVLLHSSVGAFLTHCGWNSMLESICGGVAVICWPFFADQQTNCRYACDVWGIGVEIEKNVRREDVEMRVKELMESEKGKKMRSKALAWKEKAHEAAKLGGSSFNNLGRLMKDVFHHC